MWRIRELFDRDDNKAIRGETIKTEAKRPWCMMLSLN